MSVELTDDTLPRDEMGHPIQVGSWPRMRDGAASPVLSPIAFDTDVDSLTVPENAVVLVVNPTEELRVSADGNDIQSTVTHGYQVCPADVWSSIPCAGVTTMYYTQDAAGGSLRFHFECVGKRVAP